MYYNVLYNKIHSETFCTLYFVFLFLRFYKKVIFKNV